MTRGRSLETTGVATLYIGVNTLHERRNEIAPYKCDLDLMQFVKLPKVLRTPTVSPRKL